MTPNGVEAWHGVPRAFAAAIKENMWPTDSRWIDVPLDAQLCRSCYLCISRETRRFAKQQDVRVDTARSSPMPAKKKRRTSITQQVLDLLVARPVAHGGASSSAGP